MVRRAAGALPDMDDLSDVAAGDLTDDMPVGDADDDVLDLDPDEDDEDEEDDEEVEGDEDDEEDDPEVARRRQRAQARQTADRERIARETKLDLLKTFRQAREGDADAASRITSVEDRHLYRQLYGEEPSAPRQQETRPRQSPEQLQASLSAYDRLARMRQDDPTGFDQETRDARWDQFWAGYTILKGQLGLPSDASGREIGAALAALESQNQTRAASEQLSGLDPDAAYLEMLDHPDAKRLFSERDWSLVHPSKFAGKPTAAAVAEMNRHFGAILASRQRAAKIAPELGRASAAARTARAANTPRRSVPMPSGRATGSMTNDDVVSAYIRSKRAGGSSDPRIEQAYQRVASRLGL